MKTGSGVKHNLRYVLMCEIQSLLQKPMTNQLDTTPRRVFLSFKPRTLSGQQLRSVDQTLRSVVVTSSSYLSSSTASWTRFRLLDLVFQQFSICLLPWFQACLAFSILIKLGILYILSPRETARYSKHDFRTVLVIGFLTSCLPGDR